MARLRKQKPLVHMTAATSGCIFWISLQEYNGQRRRVRGVKRSGYSSLRDARSALRRVAKSKRYNAQLRGGDLLIVTKQCIGSSRVTSTACRPTVTGEIRCAPYTGYGLYMKRRSGEQDLKSTRHPGHFRGAKKRRKKRSRRK